MFFKVLAAIVTADAFDRRMRAQQRRVWVEGEARRNAAAGVPTTESGSRRIPAGGTRWNFDAPERPT
jgi:hypothetical protein